MYKFLTLALFSFLALIPLSTSAQTTSPAEPHPPGSLVVSKGTVYVISEDGTSISYFDSAEKFLSNFYSFTDTVPANTTDMAKPISGSAAWGDGRLFNDAGTIYQVSGEQKHGFASGEIFTSYGYKFTEAIKGTLDLPVGLVIDLPNQTHLPGTLVINERTVWLINTTGRIGIPSVEALLSWGRKFSEVVPANTEDMNRPVEGVLGIRTGSLIIDNGTVWAIRAKNKFAFTSGECFVNFGFSFARLIPGSTAEYTNLGSICASPPASSYEKISIQTTRGTFTADIMKFNLAKGEVKMITDTANDEDCTNNCAVKPLADYVKDNDGFAGINGTYFCPTAYPDCVGKTNSFYWKVYNSRLGKMINANNGIKGEKPFIAINNNQITYHKLYSSYIQTNSPITAGINHEPRLVEDGAIALNEAELTAGERTSKTSRVSIGFKEQMVYIVVLRSANVPDLAAAMQSLDVDYAMHLDGGGSTAMYYEGEYKAGPGRSIPNAIIFKR